MHKDARFRAPVDMDAEQEARYAVEREECLSRFKAAVKAATERDYSKCQAIIEKIRRESGDAAAEIASNEFRKALGREAKKK